MCLDWTMLGQGGLLVTMYVFTWMNLIYVSNNGI